MQTLHHISRRKKAQKKSKYPILDYLIYIGAAIGPITTLPQAYIIWIEKSAEGVSSITWFGYAAGSLLWLVYGLVHKEYPIIFTNVAMIGVQTVVLTGSLIY